jgi:hypothetical protein
MFFVVFKDFDVKRASVHFKLRPTRVCAVHPTDVIWWYP